MDIITKFYKAEIYYLGETAYLKYYTDVSSNYVLYLKNRKNVKSDGVIYDLSDTTFFMNHYFRSGVDCSAISQPGINNKQKFYCDDNLFFISKDLIERVSEDKLHSLLNIIRNKKLSEETLKNYMNIFNGILELNPGDYEKSIELVYRIIKELAKDDEELIQIVVYLNHCILYPKMLEDIEDEEVRKIAKDRAKLKNVRNRSRRFN